MREIRAGNSDPQNHLGRADTDAPDSRKYHIVSLTPAKRTDWTCDRRAEQFHRNCGAGYQPRWPNKREPSEPDEQELTPAEPEELSGGVLHTFTPPDRFFTDLQRTKKIQYGLLLRVAERPKC
jgi:hypothetical protein